MSQPGCITLSAMKFAMLFVCVMCFTAVNAELFKWVDKNGKTHYSDKDPKLKQALKIEPEDNPAKKPFTQTSTKDAIIRPYEMQSRKILLTDVTYHWKKQAEIHKNKKIGAYYLGKHCSPRGAINVPEVYSHHSAFFPSETSLPKNVKFIIKSLGYDPEVTTHYSIMKRLETTNGLKLEAEIVDINLNSCAPVYNPARFVTPKQLKAHSFKKNRVQLTIKWSLKEKRNQVTLLETESTGYYDGWYEVKQPQSAIAIAVENATLALFSNQEFVNQLLEQPEAIKPAEKNKTPEKPSEENFWTKFLPGRNNIQTAISNQFILKSKAASVFAELSSIKTAVISHYLQYDQWPRNKEAIGLNDIMFVDHETIANLEVDAHGTISANLQEDIFGSNKIIQLVPDMEAYLNSQSMNIKWQCYSNIEKAFNAMDCDPI